MAKVGVIVFPGSNCDHDAYHALKHVMNTEVTFLWHKETDVSGLDMIIVPGGFSYGDYLRSGAIARFSPIMQELIRYAQKGGPVMGICNGFQILVETGLVPGVLLRNKYLEFICKNVFVKVDNKENSYFKNLDKNIFEFHIAHNEGNYFCTNDQLKQIEDNNQIAIYYCNDDGQTKGEFNPNGSLLKPDGFSPNTVGPV